MSEQKPVILRIDDDPGVSRAVQRDLRRQYGEGFRWNSDKRHLLDLVRAIARRVSRPGAAGRSHGERPDSKENP